ncbi:MAG: transposase [Sedimentisphaerales bacterium]|nr:transposase [Sedimentisphaerales bacterium]
MLHSWDRRDRLSVISALTCSPIHRRLGLYFDVVDHNIKADDATPFIATLLEHFPKGIILVWDRWMVHRSAGKQLARRFKKRLALEWLPAYAPELNPVEQVWNRTKYAHWANFIPQDIRHLRRAVRKSLRKSRSQRALLCSFLNIQNYLCEMLSDLFKCQ